MYLEFADQFIREGLYISILCNPEQPLNIRHELFEDPDPPAGGQDDLVAI